MIKMACGTTYNGIIETLEELGECTGLYYDKERNVMVDECGFAIFDVFSIIEPSTLMLFKTKKEDMFVYGVHGQPVELFWPEDEEEG